MQNFLGTDIAPEDMQAMAAAGFPVDQPAPDTSIQPTGEALPYNNRGMASLAMLEKRRNPYEKMPNPYATGYARAVDTAKNLPAIAGIGALGASYNATDMGNKYQASENLKGVKANDFEKDREGRIAGIVKTIEAQTLSSARYQAQLDAEHNQQKRDEIAQTLQMHNEQIQLGYAKLNAEMKMAAARHRGGAGTGKKPLTNAEIFSLDQNNRLGLYGAKDANGAPVYTRAQADDLGDRFLYSLTGVAPAAPPAGNGGNSYGVLRDPSVPPPANVAAQATRSQYDFPPATQKYINDRVEGTKDTLRRGTGMIGNFSPRGND